jgi:hypothetical protein
MKRWVGLGVVADNLLNIGRALDKAVRSVDRPPRNLRHTSQHPAGHPGGTRFTAQPLTALQKNINFAPESS